MPQTTKGGNMELEQREQAARRGLGNVKEVLHTATVLYAGWEMDNEAWVVELHDGTRAALTTSHGGLCMWTREEAEQKLAETEASAASIRKALAMWPTS